MHNFVRYPTITTTQTLYGAEIFLSNVDIILHTIELILIIFLFSSLAFFSPPSSGGIITILCNLWTETCDKNSGTTCLQSDCQETFPGNHLLLEIEKTNDDVEYNHKEMFLQVH